MIIIKITLFYDPKDPMCRTIRDEFDEAGVDFETKKITCPDCEEILLKYFPKVPEAPVLLIDDRAYSIENLYEMILQVRGICRNYNRMKEDEKKEEEEMMDEWDFDFDEDTLLTK